MKPDCSGHVRFCHRPSSSLTQKLCQPCKQQNINLAEYEHNHSRNKSKLKLTITIYFDSFQQRHAGAPAAISGEVWKDQSPWGRSGNFCGWQCLGYKYVLLDWVLTLSQQWLQRHFHCHHYQCTIVGDMSSDAGPSDLWVSSGSAQQTAWGAHRSSQWWSTGDFQWWWVWWQWWRYRITVMIRKAINTKSFWWNPDFADWAWGQHPNGIGYKVSALSSSSRSQIPGIVKLPHDPLPIISRGTLCSVQCAKSSKK